MSTPRLALFLSLTGTGVGGFRQRGAGGIGGGYEDTEGIAKELAAGVPASRMPVYIENLLALYLNERRGDEAFVNYARRQDMADLRERLDAAVTAWSATDKATAADAATPEDAGRALESTVEPEAEMTRNPQDAEAKPDNNKDQTNAA
mgnify:CR=1 FL=1